MKLNKQKILQYAEKIVKESDFFLIDLEYRGDNRNAIIEIIIDNTVGITADNCKLVSKRLGVIFDEEELITGKYRLDVSSPGVDRPLKFIEQYPKHLNRKFKIEYFKENEIETLEAKLVKIENSKLFFTEKKNEIKVNFENIKSAKVLISFK